MNSAGSPRFNPFNDLPSFFLMAVAMRTGRKITLNKRNVILDEEKHNKWSDRWLSARWVWWAKYCKRKMDSYVFEEKEWTLMP